MIVLSVKRRRAWWKWDPDLQERLHPESGADFHHGALSPIQPADLTRDPQTGDVGAILQGIQVSRFNCYTPSTNDLRAKPAVTRSSPAFYRWNPESRRRLACGADETRWCSSESPTARACPGQRKPAADISRMLL